MDDIVDAFAEISRYPVLAAVLGFLIAFIIALLFLRLLLSPIRRLWRFVTLRGAASGKSAADLAVERPGYARLMAALLLALGFEFDHFKNVALVVLRLLFLVLTFFVYSLPLTVLDASGDLPRLCAPASGDASGQQRCASSVIKIGRSLWVLRRLPSESGQEQLTETPPPRFWPQHAPTLEDILATGQDLLSTDLAYAIISTVVALMLIYLAESLLPRLPVPGPGEDRRTPPLYARIAGMTSGYQIYGVALSFLFALYLAIASIVAISIFNDQTDKVEEGKKLMAEEMPHLKQAYKFPVAQNVKAYEFPDIAQIKKNVDASIDEIRQKSLDAANKKQAETPQGPGRLAGVAIYSPFEEVITNFNYVSAWIDREINQVSNDINRLQNAGDVLKTSLVEIDDDATTNELELEKWFVRENIGHINGLLTMKHAVSLVNDYGAWLAAYKGNINNCLSDMEIAQTNINRRLKNVQEAPTKIGSDLRNFPLYIIYGDFSPVDLNRCNRSAFAPNVNEFAHLRESIDVGLGVIGWSASWLLRTEKRDLALIVGLVGFGLFGALGSSYIKQVHANEALTDSAILVPALIRGVSAAIVIFLATLGGVAAITTNGSSPNPYLIFFTCFVAAVFSEDVWKWAQVGQQKQLGDREERRPPPTLPPPRADPPNNDKTR